MRKAILVVAVIGFAVGFGSGAARANFSMVFGPLKGIVAGEVRSAPSAGSTDFCLSEAEVPYRIADIAALAPAPLR